LVVSLFAQQRLSRDDFISWYQSDDNMLLPQWQRRIASSDVILQANQYVDSWLEQAEQLISKLPAFDGITLRRGKIDKEILEKCKNLKVISRHGVGYDNVDIKCLKEKNIKLLITATTTSTSPITFELYFRRGSGTAAYIAHTGGSNHITATEVGA
jgi:hypothetical protein